MNSEQQLREGALALGLTLSDQQVQQLLDYLGLMKKWNRVYNLTAIRDDTGMVAQHLLDSLAVVPHISSNALLDVGSGAGLPGLPIAIARPQQSVTVLDSNDKKSAFMRQAVTELKLKNVSVCLRRIQDWRPETSFPFIISRAFAELADFVSWCAHLLSPAGELLAMKGQFPAAEIERLPSGFTVKRMERLTIPGLAAERHLVWITRI